MENAPHHAYSEPLDGGWYYSLLYVPASASGNNRLSRMFTKPQDRFAAMTPVCALDFEHYLGALRAMGYEESPTHVELGQIDEGATTVATSRYRCFRRTSWRASQTEYACAPSAR